MYNWYDKIKRYFRFSKREFTGLILTILIFGFIFGIDDKTGSKELGFYWYHNLLSMFLIVTLAVVVHISIQKIYALKLGYKAEFKAWYLGLFVSLVIALISQAKLLIILPGAIILTKMAKHRLGYFPYGVNVGAHSMVSAAGPLSNLALAFIFYLLRTPFQGNPLINTAIFVNIWFAIFSVLPIPYTDGMNIFFGNKLAYFFIFGFIVVASILLLLHTPLILLLFLSVAIGLLVMLMFLFFYKKID
ncbi:hypothetical protein DRJ17_02010 [Candidatus Woesearchaeota archaeon]|nr:MAG: hypothetical protein DRJ17_02010 [Candidatus Woesearchaeota archaeon]